MRTNVIITKEKDWSWDITVYINSRPVRKAWAMNEDQALGKASILADYHTDDNGQRASILIVK